MRELNRRAVVVAPDPVEKPPRRKCHVLVEFPHPELESVIVEWEIYPPTALIQLKRDTREPLQFYGKRSDIPGYADMPKKDPPELEQKLRNFLDPATGQPFIDYPWLADVVISARAFTFLQPEPDLVLPADALWEARAEALSALKLQDLPLTRSS